MGNLRIKIAAFALAVGLGGLGGYAMSSSKNPQGDSGVLTEGTKVVRRTVHAKRPKVKAVPQARAAAKARHALASDPVSTGTSGSGSSGSSSSRPVNTGSSGSSGGGSSQPPVSTGSSGGASGGGGDAEGGGGEHETGDD